MQTMQSHGKDDKNKRNGENKLINLLLVYVVGLGECLKLKSMDAMLRMEMLVHSLEIQFFFACNHVTVPAAAQLLRSCCACIHTISCAFIFIHYRARALEAIYGWRRLLSHST